MTIIYRQNRKRSDEMQFINGTRKFSERRLFFEKVFHAYFIEMKKVKVYSVDTFKFIKWQVQKLPIHWNEGKGFAH